MEQPIDLEPHYSTKDIPGKCIKCLAEQRLNSCLIELLRGQKEDTELAQTYERLVAFLKSPESQKLREDSERYLADGKQVSVEIRFVDGTAQYELKVK
ncbi:MAG: hypothetical protein DRI39_05735 [Chloroflexi bacterium]|nr:MAG: hypothetical protein DRI39_05735 [Chloroflexota bacterium]